MDGVSNIFICRLLIFINLYFRNREAKAINLSPFYYKKHKRNSHHQSIDLPCKITSSNF